MEIIDELEREKRGPYARLHRLFRRARRDGHLHRPAHRHREGRAHARPGRAPGIVYDSDPASEQQECVNKAKALFRAAEDAVRFAEPGEAGAVVRADSRTRGCGAGQPGSCRRS